VRAFVLGSVPCLLAIGSTSGAALATESARRPLPEAILTESTTDIDAEASGELEVEANAGRTAAPTGGSGATLTSVEVEWRALRELGLRLEPTCSWVQDGAAPASRELGLSGALALGLLHDRLRDLHLQAEVQARTPEAGGTQAFDPGETVLPLAADLLAAIRRERWTVRATVGAEAGGPWVHAPLHTDLAILTGLSRDERFGFVALEVRADWARRAPVMLAPEVMADVAPLGLPLRVGIALPVNVGAEPTAASYGFLFRIMWLAGGED
jgi:hypothetical protein